MNRLIKEFVEHISDGVQVSDVHGNICYMNDAAKCRLGIDGDLKAIHVRDFQPFFKKKGVWEAHIEELRDEHTRSVRSIHTHIKTGHQVPVELTVFLRRLDGQEFVFALSRNIDSEIETERKLKLRENMLKAIADTSIALSFGLNFYDSISESLPIIGNAVEVDRTYLFQFHPGPEGDSLLSQRLEWNSGVAAPQIDNPELQNLPVEMFQEFMKMMEKNQPFQAVVDELPASSDLKEVLHAQGIVSVLIIPVFHKGELWGFIGYDDCSQKRIWDEAEISILRTFSGNISLNLERQENIKEIQSLAAFPLQNPSPVIRVDQKGEVLLRNHYSKEIEGKYFRVNGKDWIHFSAFIDLLLADILSGKKDLYYEIFTDDQSHYTIIPKYIEEQGYINLYFNNVTALKQTQQKLQTAQHNIDRIVSNMRDVIWSVNIEELTLDFISPSFKSLWPFPIKDLVKQIRSGSILSFLQIEDLDRVERRLQEADDITEEIVFTVNGEKKWTSTRIKAYKDKKGRITRLDGYIIDITEEHLYEESLRLQEKKFRGIITNMNLGLLEVDLNEKIVYVNESFEKLSGYSAEELIGKSASEVFLDDEAMRQEMNSKQETRRAGRSDSYEIRIKTKDGHNRWWLISGAPNYDENGNLIGSLGIHLDITEQKKTQQKMAEAQQLAEESSTAKELFIANMSHEIRTPLNAIIGLSKQLKDYQTTTEGDDYVNYIIASGNHLQSLVDNILDFSKINSGKFELKETTFDLREVCNEVVSIIYPLADQKSLYFDYSFDDRIAPQVIADRTRLKQIVINILSNAIKFTEEGGVLFEVGLGHIGKSTQVLSISVKDTGVGMSEEFVKSIFDKFSQADNSSIRKEQGTGLGMAITKELLKLMNGSIHINSIPNEGTTVRLEIPFVYTESSQAGLKAGRSIPLQYKGKRVLIVEDNELNLLVTKGLLKKYGIIPDEARNGLEALRTVQEKEFDLILMDIQMPMMDGIQATERMIKELKIETPIIALSANALKTEIDKCYQVGMKDYLTKPIAEEEFVNVFMKYFGISEKMEDPDNPANREQRKEPLLSLQSIEMIPELEREEIISMFISESKEITNVIKDAYTKGDLKKVQFYAHKFKSQIKLFAIKELYEDIRELEENIEDLEKIRFSRIISHLDEVLEEVYYFLDNR